MGTNFHDGDHALETGLVLGLLMKAGLDASANVDAELNYTDVITLVTEDFGEYNLRVLPRMPTPPPEPSPRVKRKVR